MSVLRKIFFRSAVSKKEAKIVLLGSPGAGKTTLVRYLETGEPVEDDPKTTLGIDIHNKPIEIDGWSFRAIDVGGQELYQKTFWTLGIGQSNAVIYVIDGTTKPSETDTKWDLSLFQFEYMLSLVDKEIPLLILINKQDLKEEEPLSTEVAIRLYEIDKLVDRSFNVLPSSAKYGDGVYIAIEWLVKKMTQKAKAR